MKKYRQAFSKGAFRVYIAINIVGIAAIVVSVLKLIGVGPLVSYFLFVDITTIALFVFFLIFTGVLLFRAYYGFEEDAFVVCRGIGKQRVRRDTISKLIYDEASGGAALYYVNPLTPSAVQYVVLSVRKKDADDFMTELRSFCPTVVVEVNPAPPTVNC